VTLSCIAHRTSLGTVEDRSAINNNKYSFIKTFDKPQMNTVATTGISDAGAAPVGHQLQRLPIGWQHRSCGAVLNE